MRRIRFKPKLRDTVRQTMAHLSAYGEIPAELQASHDTLLAGMPKRRVPKDGVDIDAIHRSRGEGAGIEIAEKDILPEVGKMLHDHPRVLIAWRFNSGAVQRQTADGSFATMWFHRWIKRPEKMRLVDYFGLMQREIFIAECGEVHSSIIFPFALEVKKSSWTSPGKTDSDTHVREREQAAFLALVRGCGGIGAFVRSAAEAKAAIEG